ncbi:MAG TPA: sulfur oxidation c-type cytochrome SoxX [Burkholderiales bacterium]
MRRLAIIPVFLAVASCASAPQAGGGERRGESDAEMAELTAFLKAHMHARGQAKLERVELDEVQRLCNRYADNPPPELAKRVEQAQLASIVYPSGSLLGDWKSGEKIAQSGRGMTWRDKPGQSGGSCYNCHQISPAVEAHGTIGPSLAGFGKLRGYGPDIQRYVYGKIYNAKAYNACSHMPRFGHSGTLSEQQIKDLTALLLDPASPVNQ